MRTLYKLKEFTEDEILVLTTAVSEWVHKGKLAPLVTAVLNKLSTPTIIDDTPGVVDEREASESPS
jgi:hypothetical protein